MQMGPALAGPVKDKYGQPEPTHPAGRFRLAMIGHTARNFEMLDNQNFDPATEPPADIPHDHFVSHVTDRGSIWFVAGVLSVMLVFGLLWFVGVVDPALEEQRVATSFNSSPIDRQVPAISSAD
ncbi:hypothetical protein B7H23_10310 [Notoacmeibacter marinus]|uniref:Uncharacterized protein n=1 Tax=Notoacmeibacter marinus TaxID=1876515 RepID=A0A231UX86_9HYPH|nr:hypothetical protein [Notoacmeibacter marinus]OXT00500.1 hypothetical protein B7H23_10310 [Notoacmeibacter marinus]